MDETDRPMDAAAPRWLRVVLWTCLISFAAMIALSISLSTIYPGGDRMPVVLSVLLAALYVVFMGTGLVTLGYLYIKQQARIMEWLVTIWAVGIVLGVTQKLGKSEPAGMLFVGISTFLILFIGNIWAWSVCRRLGIERGAKRWLLLATGWAGAVGVLFNISAVLILLLFFIGGEHMGDREQKFFLYRLVIGLLTIPAIVMEIRARRAAAG